jgi:hypothetical protein
MIDAGDHVEYIKYEKALLKLECSYVLNYAGIELYLKNKFSNPEYLLLEYSIDYYDEYIKILEKQNLLVKDVVSFSRINGKIVNGKIIRYKNKLNAMRIKLKNFG